jgi:hypothetical protein
MKPHRNAKHHQAMDEAGSKLPDRKFLILDPFMTFEVQRQLIHDDVYATQKLVNPKGIQEDKKAVRHHYAYKFRTNNKKKSGGKSGGNNSDDMDEASLSFKVCCCCCYLGKKYFNIGFGWIIMAVIVLMLIGIALLKLDENVWYLQSVQNLEKIDYYEVLELTNREATTKDIKRAHRQMTRRWHPDRNPDCGETCVQKMAKVTEAYIVLSNPETRKYHDTYHVKPPEKMIQKAREQQHSKKER